jgi:endonuclease IV
MQDKTLFRIKYEDVFSGKSIYYMNIGFETELSAQKEIDRIVKEQNRLKSLGLEFVENKYNSAVFSGKN